MKTKHVDTAASIKKWLAEPLSPEVDRALRRLTTLPDVRHVAVMPDVHEAGDACVGTVFATERFLFPSAIGGDIGCGMFALPLNCETDVLANETVARNLLERLRVACPVNRHRHARTLPDALRSLPLSDARLEAVARRDGRVQFGTLGRGNHFLEFQADEVDRLWLTIHTGSRAVGQAVKRLHLASADATTALPAVEAGAASGRAYLNDVEWARAYAKLNRESIAMATLELLQRVFTVDADGVAAIDCDHNHIRREPHFGQEWWVHRKGAMPAGGGELGVLPGSMGTATYHVEGRGEPQSLRSSAHGAGRAMSRERARQSISLREVRRAMRRVWYDERAIDRLRDESPAAYRDVAATLRAQRDLTRVVRRLRPVLVYKGV